MEISKETEVKENIYEIGYLLLSSIPEEKIPSSIEKITTVLNKSVKVISQGSPEFIDLAYPMSVKSEGKRDDYDTAYFGWIKFESKNGEDVVKIKEELDKISDILRYILVKTLRDDNLTTPKNIIKKKREEAKEEAIKIEKENSQEENTEKKEEVKKETSDKEVKDVDEKKIDETIDNLVIE